MLGFLTTHRTNIGPAWPKCAFSPALRLLTSLGGFFVGPTERVAGDFKNARACTAVLRKTGRGRFASAKQDRSPTAGTRDAFHISSASSAALCNLV